MFSMRRLRRRLPSRHDSLLLLIGALVACVGFGIAAFIHNAQVPLRPETSSINSPWIPSTVKRWSGPIDEMSKKYNIDPDALAIIMTLESGGYSKANSGEAQGLMQITPLTAKDIAHTYLKKPVSSYNIWDPRTNIEFGAAYLAYLRDQFGAVNQGPSWDNTMELMAAGYNGGPGAANLLAGGHGLENAQTIIYSRDAFNMWRERHAYKSPTYDRWLERGGSQLVDLAKAQK